MSSQTLNTIFESKYEISINKSSNLGDVVVCLRCGRPLTNEKSRLARLGPKCARKLAYETRAHSYSLRSLKCYQKALSPYIRSYPQFVPTQQISLYYKQNSSEKPTCRIGMVSLSSTDNDMDNYSGHRKRWYSLPLLEGVRYQIFAPLPQPRIFWLQVQNQQLKEISKS